MRNACSPNTQVVIANLVSNFYKVHESGVKDDFTHKLKIKTISCKSLVSIIKAHASKLKCFCFLVGIEEGECWTFCAS
jgi:hypothetical protein